MGLRSLLASLLSLLLTPLHADLEVRYFIGQFESDQVIELEQTDSSVPRHRRSTFSLTTRIETDDAGPQFLPAPNVALPAGATGSIRAEDFTTIDPNSARFSHETTEIDGLLGYPPGDYVLTFRTADDDCSRIETLARRLDDPPGESPYNLRTRIINKSGWHDGKLCLPKENLIIRWETIGSGLIVFGDREEENRISIRDAETRDLAYADHLSEASEPVYPQIVLPGQQGVDLSHLDALVNGRTYEVELEKRRTTIVIMGDTQSEHTVTLRTKFLLYVDPSAPLPPSPKLEVASDDARSEFYIWWDADPDHDYLVVEGLSVMAGAGGGQSGKLTAPGQLEAHSFSKPTASGREFFRILTIPK
ncbi:MAG: hypothetical protein ACR2RV_25040 [Verrucomicrobiales bacterium]